MGFILLMIVIPASLIAAVIGVVDALEKKGDPLRSRWWLWLLAGALYGVGMRYWFGFEVGKATTGAMSLAFLVVTPFGAGALTVYGIHRTAPTLGRMILAPWATISLMAAGCAVTLLEGSICIAIMLPLLLICASLGGVTMGLLMRHFGRRTELTAIALLPLLVAPLEGALPQREHRLAIDDSVVVYATPAEIWEQIMTAQDIKSDELPLGINRFIGVPSPVAGVNFQTDGGEIRYSTWERGIRFHARVTERKLHESITWQYEFAPDSFPAGSMDEHVAVGGKYFDLLDTNFRFVPIDANTTRLEIRAHYRVQSAVNVYAIPVSRVLGRDFLRTLLTLYKHRSEGPG